MNSILVYFPGPIVPLTMANRVRVYNTIIFLSKRNKVTFLSIVDNEYEQEQTKELLSKNCECIFINRPKKNSFTGTYLRIFWIIVDYFGWYPKDFIQTNGFWLNNQIIYLLKDPKFDLIIGNYWYSAPLIKALKETSTFKAIIDTHNVLSQQAELELKIFRKVFNKRKWLSRYRFLEHSSLEIADSVIAISSFDFFYYKNKFPNKVIENIPIGIDSESIEGIKLEQDDKKIILFYGNMSSSQNIIAFNRLWKDIFLPLRAFIPDLQLLIVGSNPPQQILTLNQLEYVTVTGFVDKPLDYIRKAKIHVIPLETGSGFRGRVIETMGLGIPTVGTHNALDCLELPTYLQHLVSDNNTDLIEVCINLLNDHSHWVKISEESRKFIYNIYSFENTLNKFELLLN